MNATAKVKSPDDFEVTITLVMKVSELREMKKLQDENDNRNQWPLSELTRQLRQVSEQVDRVYIAEPVTMDCPECGVEVTFK